jgi:hypothetical protein
MEDACSILSLPDDPGILKSMIVIITRERDIATRQRDEVQRQAQQLEIEKLRLEVELLRFKKWYYGPRADRLQQPGDVAQLLLQFGHGIDPQHYLTQLLTNLPTTPMTQLPAWLPEAWKRRTASGAECG